MAEPETKARSGPAIARIIAAHARAPAAPARRGTGAERAFGRALRHAAAPFAGLSLTLGEVAFIGDVDLLTALEAQPDHGLLAALEDTQGRRGLVALSPGFVDALIEVQTTGRVEPGSLPPRPVTDIDEALSRDYIDLVLSALAREAAAVEGRDWPLRMQFGSRVTDRGQLNLLMPDTRYHLFRAEVAFDGTDRRAQVCLVLPCDPALAAPAPESPARPKGQDPAWQEKIAATLADTPLALEAVLLRVRQPLGEVQSLAVGDVIPFAAQDLQTVTLEDALGRAVLVGRLGQFGGKRAIRLAAAKRDAAAATPRPEAPPPASAASGASNAAVADAPAQPPLHAPPQPTQGAAPETGAPPVPAAIP